MGLFAAWSAVRPYGSTGGRGGGGCGKTGSDGRLVGTTAAAKGSSAAISSSIDVNRASGRPESARVRTSATAGGTRGATAWSDGGASRSARAMVAQASGRSGQGSLPARSS